MEALAWGQWEAGKLPHPPTPPLALYVSSTWLPSPPFSSPGLLSPAGDKPLPVPAEGCTSVPPFHQGVPGQGEPRRTVCPWSQDTPGRAREGG